MTSIYEDQAMQILQWAIFLKQLKITLFSFKFSLTEWYDWTLDEQYNFKISKIAGGVKIFVHWPMGKS
jgi:hypothetical protein